MTTELMFLTFGIEGIIGVDFDFEARRNIVIQYIIWNCSLCTWRYEYTTGMSMTLCSAGDVDSQLMSLAGKLEREIIDDHQNTKKK